MKRSNAEPIRSCCACRQKQPKHALQRFVWREGTLVADSRQNQPGRGAYSCHTETCLELVSTRKKMWKRMFRL